ncbi:hypothetical protein OJF2_76660 [Aquisphaera giovannonii]|uniref:Uncharacterized protein n=1 Tax=Aquisphaera giovannonii TaxID=406548 RepID=A0A5B9WFN5_9BACT|nr:hypothetical protein OJF2_76660 [Aquisphaera giovannonii]
MQSYQRAALDVRRTSRPGPAPGDPQGAKTKPDAPRREAWWRGCGPPRRARRGHRRGPSPVPTRGAARRRWDRAGRCDDAAGAGSRIPARRGRRGCRRRPERGGPAGRTPRGSRQGRSVPDHGRGSARSSRLARSPERPHGLSPASSDLAPPAPVRPAGPPRRSKSKQEEAPIACNASPRSWSSCHRHGCGGFPGRESPVGLGISLPRRSSSLGAGRHRQTVQLYACVTTDAFVAPRTRKVKFLAVASPLRARTLMRTVALVFPLGMTTTPCLRW